MISILSEPTLTPAAFAAGFVIGYGLRWLLEVTTHDRPPRGTA